jgi:hypothetical protein
VELKTVKVDNFGYTCIEAARRMLEEVMPTPVTMGTVVTFGAFLVLQRAGELKADLAKSPKGQIYLKLAEVLRKQARSKSVTNDQF